VRGARLPKPRLLTSAAAPPPRRRLGRGTMCRAEPSRYTVSLPVGSVAKREAVRSSAGAGRPPGEMLTAADLSVSPHTVSRLAGRVVVVGLVSHLDHRRRQLYVYLLPSGSTSSTSTRSTGPIRPRPSPRPQRSSGDRREFSRAQPVETTTWRTASAWPSSNSTRTTWPISTASWRTRSRWPGPRPRACQRRRPGWARWT
jgi:hypothetical protein